MSSDLIAELDRLGAAALGGTVHVGPLPTSGDEQTVAGQLIAASQVADVDFLPAEPTRMRFAKRLVFRFARLFMHRQKAYNLAMIAALSDLNQQVAILRARSINDTARTAATMAHLSISVDEMTDQIDRVAGLVRAEAEAFARDTDSRIREQEAGLRAGVVTLRTDLDAILHDLRSPREPGNAETPLSGETLQKLTTTSARDADAFYERFEDRMRGTGADVRATLEPYLADLEKIRPLGGQVIDIGSGRGEWLKLLSEAGFDALGIDTNSAAVETTRRLGLQAEVADGIDYLMDLEPASVLSVTCFHVVEHLTPDVQLSFLKAALRSLKPGGLLIVETPNPTNLNVGAASFFLDPTHLRPVNPSYLSFVLSDLGFVEVETRFLHPRQDFVARGAADMTIDDEVMWALRGPQDFAVLARTAVTPAGPAE